MAGELSGDIQVPAVGKVPKKVAAGGVLVVGTLVVVYYVRRNKAAAASTTAAAAATATDQYPPDGTVGNPDDPYSTDPATGQTYGDESVGAGTYGAYGTSLAGEEALAGEGVTDTYPWDGTTGNEADPYSLDPATGVTYGDEGLATGGVNANPAGGPPFSSNSAWSNWVIAQMVANDSTTDVSTLTDALGLYLNGQPVDTSQQQMIFDAIAIGGDPPVAGPNGYPPAVHLNGNTGGSGNIGTSTGGGTPAGGGVSAGTAPSAPTGITVSPTSDPIHVEWNAIPGATSYNFGISPAPKGGVASIHNIGNRHGYNVGGIVKGTTYTVTVTAQNGEGTSSAAKKSFKAT